MNTDRTTSQDTKKKKQKKNKIIYIFFFFFDSIIKRCCSIDGIPFNKVIIIIIKLKNWGDYLSGLQWKADTQQ